MIKIDPGWRKMRKKFSAVVLIIVFVTIIYMYLNSESMPIVGTPLSFSCQFAQGNIS